MAYERVGTIDFPGARWCGIKWALMEVDIYGYRLSNTFYVTFLFQNKCQSETLYCHQASKATDFIQHFKFIYSFLKKCYFP